MTITHTHIYAFKVNFKKYILKVKSVISSKP